MLFSRLEKDKKTYNYSKKYLDFTKECNGNCIVIFENALQAEELKEHFRINNTPDNDEFRSWEAQVWIGHNAEKFRKYLNSIKLLVIMIDINREYTFEYFSELVDRFNNMKNNIIDSIY